MATKAKTWRPVAPPRLAICELVEVDAPPTVPLDALRVVMEFVDGYVGECLTTNEVELATYDVNLWLDAQGKGASDGE